MIPLDFSAEVAAALGENRPVVALESTIITHGFPYPDNLRMAEEVEATIRAAGAVPATIAVLGGRAQIGLAPDALSRLAQMPTIAKLSRADLAATMALGGDGATTVAATMILARAAGLSVFATGGIGGVHRGAEQSFDISADLQELAQSAVTVVCAGAKAILDLPKTLEVLETLGVPVIGYGCDTLPAFWSRQSELAVPIRMDTPADIAKAHHMRAMLGLPGGQLVANPIPASAQIPAEELRPIIATLTDEAAAKGITGKAVTPFLLGQMAERTAGRSVAANRALVLNNARLAAEIAQEMAG